METTEQNMTPNVTPAAGKLSTEKKIIIALIIVIVFLAGCFVGYYKISQNRNVAEPQQVEEPKITVVTMPVTTRTFERIVAVQGNLESKNFALVSPRIMGTIEKFFVDEGNTVIANETKLFATDSIALEQTVQIQRKLLDIAESTKKQAKAELEKIKADFNKVQLDYDRYKRLYDKKVVTADAFERQESQYNQIKAEIKAANAKVELAESDIRKAQADLAIADKNLSDAVVYAPISGKVSRRFKEPGEMGNPGEPAVRIDDNIIIETSAYLPAVCYPEVKENETRVKISVSGRDLGEYDIYYKSPTINPKLRTFEVKCLLDNTSGSIAAGAMAEVKVVLESKKSLAVPTEAIQTRDNQSVIFVVSDGRAHKVAVQKGLENDGWIEVAADELNEQCAVVTMGQNMLDEGKAVSIQKENK